MAVSQLFLVGDSLTQGDSLSAPHATYQRGGKGSWANLMADRLGNIPNLGPLLSSGFQPAANDVYSGTVLTGSWTAVTSANAYDKAPYGKASFANGITNTCTFVKPPLRNVVGFALYWTDYSLTGNWQYSIDGGVQTNMGQTLHADNSFNSFYVGTAVGQNVVVRAGNGGGNVDCLPNGIEWFYINPVGATQGLIVHNVAVGGTDIHDLVLPGSGDRMAIFDSVVSAGPLAAKPNVGVVIEHINDTKDIINTTTWAADIATFNTRVSPLGPVGIWSPYEDVSPLYDSTVQASYRAQTKTTAASLGMKTIDIYDQWASNGWTGYAAAVAAGLIHADTIHPSQLGHYDLASRLYWFVRNKILNLGNVQTSYPVAAKRPSNVLVAKKAALTYSAGTPIVIS